MLRTWPQYDLEYDQSSSLFIFPWDWIGQGVDLILFFLFFCALDLLEILFGPR